jgi:signal transduction histidine kinase/CheY-like chemotaxis protein
MDRLLSRRSGQPALARPALAIVLVMLLVMAVSGFFGVRLIDSVQQLHDSANRAGQVAHAADAVLDALQDSETSVRGYLLTMRPVYLEPYAGNREKLDAALGALDALAVGSPWLRDELTMLRADAVARMQEIDQTLRIAQAKGSDAALAVILTDRGRSEMDRVRASATRILRQADAERESRVALLIARERQTLDAVIATALAATLLLGFAALGLLFNRARLMSAKAALSAQSDRLQGTLDHIREGVAVFDSADRLVLWNPSFFPVTGIARPLAEPGTAYARFADAASWLPPAQALIPAGGDPPTSPEIRVGDKVLEVWHSRMRDGGRILAVADITRRTRAEAIARQAQKMEALGQLTGGVAHDFNNLLQVISANLELVDARLPEAGDKDWLRARLAAARAGVERGAGLIRHLLSFARREPLARRAIWPAAVLRGMEEMLGRTLGRTITVQFAVPEKVWPIRVDPQQFENAVLNLAINSRDAIEAADAGQETVLRIGLAEVALDEAAAGQHGLPAGDYVRLDVTDSGAGMSETTMARAAEPFFTTKDDGRGTGLGLAMVYGFARQSGGAMRIDSRPGRGTTVTLLIPRTTELPGEPLVSPSRGLRGKGERLLVVEADPAVSIAACTALTDHGYRVTAVGTGQECLRVLAGAAAPDAEPTGAPKGASEGLPEVLIIDAAIPDRPDGPARAGPALAERVRGLHPGLAIVLATGDASHDPTRVARCTVLPKPWSRDELVVAVRQALRMAEGPAGQRLVLAEDDAAVRTTTAEVLAGFGYVVTQAASAGDALRLLDGRTDILLTDLGLPDFDGAELARRALAGNPGLSVVIVSGNPPPAAQIADPRIGWLAKPYSAKRLIDALAAARSQVARPASGQTDRTQTDPTKTDLPKTGSRSAVATTRV